jgi:hypothetical protein
VVANKSKSVSPLDLLSHVVYNPSNVFLIKVMSSNPIIHINFGGIDFGRCTIFFKAPTESFSKKVSFDNENASNYSFEVDPGKLLDSTDLSDLVGCTVRWIVTFADIEEVPGSEFSFNLKIKQDGVILKDFSQIGKILDTSVSFAGDHTF